VLAACDRAHRDWSADDITTLSALALQAGLALERANLAAQSQRLSFEDPLTGLPNRSLFQDRLAQALQRSLRGGTLMAVLYIDVDKFKAINDTLGHSAGDALLKEFARRLSACVRATDTVARFGGDEFAVILEGLGRREDGARIAGKIVAAMRPGFALEGKTASVSASVGIAFHDQADSLGAEGLLKAADQALYKAKGEGRDGFRIAA
jgi:diguanylate cyclase (GGDEF)-like protein